jgi:hypothetical protein
MAVFGGIAEKENRQRQRGACGRWIIRKRWHDIFIADGVNLELTPKRRRRMGNE